MAAAALPPLPARHEKAAIKAELHVAQRDNQLLRAQVAELERMVGDRDGDQRLLREDFDTLRGLYGALRSRYDKAKLLIGWVRRHREQAEDVDPNAQLAAIDLRWVPAPCPKPRAKVLHGAFHKTKGRAECSDP